MRRDMTALSPFLSIEASCDQALPLTRDLLSRAGLSAVQTFNLNTARLGSPLCDCPNHGTEACDCQMIVLLIYDESVEPATLVLHGNDGMTWITIVDATPQTVDTRLVSKIQHSLAGLAASDS